MNEITKYILIQCSIVFAKKAYKRNVPLVYFNVDYKIIHQCLFLLQSDKLSNFVSMMCFLVIQESNKFLELVMNQIFTYVILYMDDMEN